MTTYPLQKITLFEYDRPIDLDELLNVDAGLWVWTITNTVETITDDFGTEGFYNYQQSERYGIKSLSVDGELYSRTLSLADCRETNKSFYYDTETTKLYIHFDNFEPPLDKSIFFGAAVGYSKLPNDLVEPTFNGIYYEPRLSSIPGIKKSIDPLFFGLLKYFTGTVTLTNKDGHFDTWRARNLFGQPARVLVGDITDEYENFQTVVEGFISDDSRTFDEFSVELEDPRKALTQPVATNTLTTTNWPDLSDSNIDAVKPVAYGVIRNAKAICLNEEETPTPALYTFLICDTEFNSVSALDKIYVDGVETAITGTADFTAGTFTMTAASVSGNLGNVTIDFVGTSFDNGVEIIKDLMLNYDSKPFNSSFWDTAEVNTAETESRDTSLYINDGSRKLSEALESVSNDIDARFFTKNSGLYTIRIYDEDRTPITKELINDEWLDNPGIQNNGSEYLSSVIIEYKPDQESDEYLRYENTDFQQEAFDRYKKLKVNTFTTNLPTLADAQDKSNTIMNISKLVQDIVTRKTSWDNFGIEPSDFVIGSPTSRLSEADIRGIYEVMDISNNPDDFSINLSLRFIKNAPAAATYSTIDDNIDSPISDNNDMDLLGRLT